MTSARACRLEALFVLLAAAAGCGGATHRGDASALPRLHTEGRFFKDDAGKTVILRGVAFADVKELDTARAPMNVARLIDLVSDAGQGWYARVVRLVVFPDDWRPDPDGYLQTVLKPAVAHATARGLYAIVDWHEISDAAPADAETRAFWAKAAPVFGGEPNVLFEVFNEAMDLDDTSWARWKATAQPWVDQIRQDAPSTIILIGAPFWTQALGGAVGDPFAGSDLAYVGHIYPGIDPSVWGPGGAFTQVAAVRPMMITEWGFRAEGPSPTTGDQASFGDALKAYVEEQQLGWTAWCADTVWESVMFDPDWNLLTGPSEMGGFTKDWLAEKKDAAPASGPSGTGGAPGTGGVSGAGGGEISIDCGAHLDASACAAVAGCYWREADCHSATAVCAFAGGIALPPCL